MPDNKTNIPKTVTDHIPFFSENVDDWGAAEWFGRLAAAIREQDKAVLAKDSVATEICQNVAASSAMRLVREFENEVRSALIARPPAKAEAEPVAAGYVSPITLKILSENANGCGSIVAAAAFDTIIPLYTRPPAPVAEKGIFGDRVPCHCHDDTSRRFCLDKGRCYTINAQAALNAEGGAV